MGAVVLGSVFMFVSALSSKDANLGTASVTNSNVLNQARLATEITNAVAPLQNIGNGATAAIDFASLATSTLAQSTTTVVNGLAASLGDEVLVQPVTPTAGVYFSGYVSTASTTSATITIVEQLSAYAAADATSTVFNVVTLPFTSFKAVTGL